MLEISTAFPNSSESILSFLNSDTGFYIPLYQRQYSWSEDNIEQLMESIFWGVKELLEDENAIRFMGTIILFQEQDRDNNIKPQDRRALPKRIDNVIDGQQRISTIAILATQLYFKLLEKKKFFNEKKEPYYIDLCTDIETKLTDLLELFSLNLRRGKPSRKPLIIRGSIDQWTLDGEDETNYKSDISKHLASAIRAIEEERELDIEKKKKSEKTLVDINIGIIDKWIEKLDTNYLDEDPFPRAEMILKGIKQDSIWSYERKELVGIINKELSSNENDHLQLSSTVRILAFIHYLCSRACFTLIEPRFENWAFDMFQSLNATGTPLTAIETFKPLVVNDFDNIEDNSRFKGSETEKYFDNIEKYIESSNIKQKEKITSEYLTTFALCYDGNKNGMTTQFSSQRAWLNKAYSPNQKGVDEKQGFVRKMSDVALFLKNVINFDPDEKPYIDHLHELIDDERDLVAINCLYLRDSNHKMSYTVLSLFYSNVLRKKPGAAKDFLEATKIITSFYSLWRSSGNNSGIDEVYRKLLKGTEEQKGISWKESNGLLELDKMRQHFKTSFSNKREVNNFESWFRKSQNSLWFNKAKSICRYTLILAAHDTILDENNPGMVKIGMPGVNKCLKPKYWVSKKLKTVEHIAPQNNRNGWDEEIYIDDSHQKIGNLTLLPIAINSSLGNRPWKEKIIYYRHLSESDPDKLEKLREEATSINLTLDEKKLEALQAAEYNYHILPIVFDNSSFVWDKSIIDKRTENLCSILWERSSDILGF